MKILIVEDERHIRQGIVEMLAEEGYEMLEADSLQAAYDQLADGNIDMILSDIRLPDGDGFDLLRALKVQNNPLPCILMTAFGNRELAEQALKNGAYDYISKPIRFDELLARLMRLNERLELEQQLNTMSAAIRGGSKLTSLGSSQAMHHVRHLAEKATAVRSPVLIEGETGVGKGRLVKLIHASGVNASEPLVQLNCSAIPSELMESELFGHKKGAFSGADRNREGLLTAAGKGTLFLDEIGELPLPMQAKLLHVLDDGRFRPVGDTREQTFEARVIAATNRNLREEIQQKRFREDLYFRLDVLRIRIPPLRERQEDIVPLAIHILKEHDNEATASIAPLDTDQCLWLQNQAWPGNVRELRNTLERALLLSRDRKLCIPPTETEHKMESKNLVEAVAHFERNMILQTIAHCQGDKERAANKLAIGLSTLYRKLEG